MTVTSLRGAIVRLLPIVTCIALLAACSVGHRFTVGTSVGAGGSLSPTSARVRYGNTTSFTVIPDSGYDIGSVSGCGGILSGTSYTTGPVTHDCTVTATFYSLAAPTYSLSASAGSGGAISPTSATVNEGDTFDFTVTPDTGYSIGSVSGCGGSLSGTTYTTGAITSACTVTASFAQPTVSIAAASVSEGNSGTTNLTFTVSLSGTANGDVTVDYTSADGTASGDTSCSAGVDYVAASGTLIIASGNSSGTVDIAVCGDTVPEGNETLTLTLSNVSAAQLATAAATGTLTNDDAFGKLNDTGITLCGDYAWGGSGTHNNNVACAGAGATATVNGTETANGLDPVPAGQDAHYGRDVTANAAADGSAGFSFTKLGSDGKPLAIQNGTWNEAGSEAAGTMWSCVLDNVTGLTWEVKTTSGLHSRYPSYTWYNSDSATNGGSPGTVGAWAYCMGVPAGGCDTEHFVAAVNAAGFCGASDWRLPSKDELQTILDLGHASLAIDAGFFPNTRAGYFWSASSFSFASGMWPDEAWFVSFGQGEDGMRPKSADASIRVVRGGE